MAESIDDSLPLIEEKDLEKFSLTLDQFNSVIPETVTKYYMQQSALQTDDERCVKLMSLSVQKFMSEIINGCFQLQKLREKSNNRPVTNTQPTVIEAKPENTDQAIHTVEAKKPTPSTNNTLKLNDLTDVLEEFDINVKKTYYYT
ncbi:unnamed protein product [Adineta steineri]|uniref:Transcription initiation factor TFIID subunit 10 n=1 Tax=Adineta steineri TaxID=433720 RepID=A0A814N140_9BILA|nr:unnamed protein product [Adineta steineri]